MNPVLFRIDPVQWCPAVPVASAADESYVTLALLALTVWLVVGVLVACVDYWALDDEDVAEATPAGLDEWVSVAWVYLLKWPWVLYAMFENAAYERNLARYSTVGGQGCSE